MLSRAVWEWQSKCFACDLQNQFGPEIDSSKSSSSLLLAASAANIAVHMSQFLVWIVDRSALLQNLIYNVEKKKVSTQTTFTLFINSSEIWFS